jgi:dihydropteroate synthase
LLLHRSTRPGAKEIAVEQQIQRTIPVIKKLRQVSDVPISIDTRHADVARAAIEAGADIVNDVSGGTFDPNMLSTVSELNVPMILMHMRGTPESMQTMTEYKNVDVCNDVADALLEISHDAEEAGIHRWVQVLDPGIGFAKDQDGNLQLLKQTATTMREKLQGIPILLGTSRKGFLGKITGETNAAERDFGSVASCVVALCLGSPSPSNLGCNILRVHNVKGTKQATLVMDAISKVH